MQWVGFPRTEVAAFTSKLATGADGEIKSEDEASFYKVIPSMGTLWTYRQSLDGFGYAGVKLGEKERMTFWYRPKGSETYRLSSATCKSKTYRPTEFLSLKMSPMPRE